MKKNMIVMSITAAMVLSTGANAGLIKTDADVSNIEVTPNKQFGFGGWSFDNINVEMINVETGDPSGGTFDTTTGEYTGLVNGGSFKSEVISTEDNVTVLGDLNGKDYPVGEPAGVKVINNDTECKHGKPQNCILTTSYLSEYSTESGESGYLDTTAAAGPQPVICSSPFQTHKRFKISMLPESVVNIDDTVGGYGKPIDLVFNLVDGDTSVQRYQVFQKINNYTDKRLAGYKMEVLDENGSVNAALTMSLGFGEGDEGADIWDIDDLANMSHGLWGVADENFPDGGFFDVDARAHYPVAITSPNAIEYNGPMQGSGKTGDYQNLFGNWLPSIWEPTGIFWDHDDDPDNDPLLMAFYGDPDGDGINDWHKGVLDNWATPTDQDILQWATDPKYFPGAIEDVLNLGINYIINVGDNSQIGSTFTLRVTPYVAANDQTPPTYMDDNITIPEPPMISDGTVAVSPAPSFLIGSTLILSVKDADQNSDAAVADTVEVEVTTDTGDKETVTLTETDVDSEVFTGSISSELTSSAPVAGDGKVNVIKDAVVTVTYQDNDGARTATTKATVLDTDDGTDTDGESAGSGGGCTYNPNSNSFDMTFLMMIALGSLYAFRRRFIK